MILTTINAILTAEEVITVTLKMILTSTKAILAPEKVNIATSKII